MQSMLVLIDDKIGILYMVFQHPSFETIELGALIPEVYIMHKRLYLSEM